MKKILLAVMAATSLFFVSCKESEKIDGEWRISALIKDGVAQALVESNITFDTKSSPVRVGGCSGVNFYSAEASVKNGKISVSDKFALTRKMGSPEEMEFEDLFLKVLISADSYTLSDDTLSIKNSDGTLELQFVKK